MSSQALFPPREAGGHRELAERQACNIYRVGDRNAVARSADRRLSAYHRTGMSPYLPP